ncbi:MAG: NifU family protein [Epsilonproteobacteria bacterium]|nr:NifU family protein [Campylobacterota bacterium]
MMPFSDEDLEYPINNIINTKIAPMLAKDGGAIKLLKIKNGIVYIQLQGACIGCASSGTTLKFIVEKNLKELIHSELEIKNIPFGLEDQIPND